MPKKKQAKKQKNWDYEIFGAVVIIIILVGLTLFYYGTPASRCGIQECHGLDITCGPDAPDVCTEIYQFGDNCRKFAKCEVLDGQCQFVENYVFTECKACVEKCMVFSDASAAFECESKCGVFETFCWEDEDCVCGVHVDTGECFFGNSEYVDETEQCPDFCTGIIGDLAVECIENMCTQVVVV